ncbi:membrane protein insertase YidC [Pseudonocardiaceae bacterium YIM PH 21723]|nr:membrane protein insertase YidC [Pseudonocardiaceae bacterium YIM PH 21723]
MLNFVYYPVSAILWFWHMVFGKLFGPTTGIAWALGVVFLVFTLRALLYKPFVGQVRSMKKMQEFAPEIKKLRDKYGNDKQKLAQEMQKLQAEHGVNPLGGCLPMLVQIPVFIGLFHVLKSFNRVETLHMTVEQNRNTANYVFSPAEVQSFLDSRLFGAPLSSFITETSKALEVFNPHVDRTSIIIVSIPLMIIASIATHFTARHSVQRQTAAAADNPQTAIMNKLTMYIFPLGVLVGGFFFPIAILIYWLSNNMWTLGQQYVVYHKIDAEEAEKKAVAVEARKTLAPKPGQKPTQSKGKRPAAGGTKSSNGQVDASVVEDGETPGLIEDNSAPGKRSKKRS